MHNDFAWDFDGTLCDSYPHIFRSFKQTLAAFGIKDDDKRIMDRITVTARDAAALYAKECHFSYDEFMKLFHSRDDRTDFVHVKPFPGVMDVLKEVKARGGRNLLFTHRPKGVFRYLEHYGMMPYFECFVTGSDEYPPKPAPDGLYLLMERSGTAPTSLVMVGDRIIDVESAWNAGCESCFFNYRKGDIPSHATWVVEDFESLLALLPNIMNR